LDEDKPHDQHHQKREQDAPPHAQHSPLILLFEIALDQLLKKKAVMFQSLQDV